METKTDSTTEEQASQEENLTSKLFADLAEDETLPETKQAETKDVSPTPEEENKKTPTVPEYLDTQEFGDKKVKVKVDGVEMEIPFKDVVKGYQTDQYLTQKGQKIAEERKRQEIPKPEFVPDDEYIDPMAAKHIKELQEELHRVKENEYGISLELAPLRYDRTMTAIDTKMKQEGFADFKDKLPEIEKILFAMPPDKMAIYDNQQGFEFLYKNLKLGEFKKASEEKPKKPDERPKPKVIPIESSSSPSGGESNNEKTKAFDKAKATGDWTEYFMKFG